MLDADTKAVIRHPKNITVECYDTAEMHCAFLTEHGEDVSVSAERDQLVEFLQSGYDSGGRYDEELGILEAEDVQNHVECLDGSEAEVETDEDGINDSETEEEEERNCSRATIRARRRDP